MALDEKINLVPVEIEQAVKALHEKKHVWPKVSVAERIALLAEIKECLMPVAAAWAQTAARKKGIPEGSPVAGEEWISGPYAVMAYCNALMQTLSKVEGKLHLESVPLRELPNGQLAARVVPHSLWDRLLLSGVNAEVWMEPGVTRANLAQNTASIYTPGSGHEGKLALILGAGNIAAIAPLDGLHKLFAENQVAIIKMNPVNEYLTEFLIPALMPLISRGFLRIVHGDVSVGQYLCNHPLVEEIHITGSGAAHDQIVWGSGEEGAANKRAGTPKNKRRITSELGAVCPTIVVPGPWSKADIAFQAEHVATQKLHNSGFNCIACQVLVLPQNWMLKSDFLLKVRKTVAATAPRKLYYPGVQNRLAGFLRAVGNKGAMPSSADECVITAFSPSVSCPTERDEVFGPALAVTELPAQDAESFLIAAIDYANKHLYGTLGANILIHPATMREIGRKRFDEIIADLHYGCIAVNAWTGLGFLSAPTPWGAFPGHTLDDVQSGIGSVHNTLLFDKPQRTVIEAPFQPFPRGLLRLSFAMLPRPPWFVTNRRADKIGQLLTEFQYRPSFAKLPRIFFHALLG
ncbi:aldehyde dehydrogenase family protein [Herbaspirillum sp. ST 5-3]|uniref:aldehyde dehydrogenase family protein n=1 Tax=Oxalobacteraceae TaxID=75682 RepID=UPI0010A3BF5B|nr:aldehyde dehydrogenase family protein [Herbaspirillum sp. ST 5-3]